MSNEWIDTAKQISDAEVEAGIRKFCPMCGQELKPRSISYFEGYHIDGCD
jgi:hypothetical protein